MKPIHHCLLVCLTLALAACHSSRADVPPAGSLKPDTARVDVVPQAPIYFGDEYSQEQRRLADRPAEPIAPTF
jgi:hypothetical protein